MKYAMVESQATVYFRYLVALEENEDLHDAHSFVDQNELDDLLQCWDDEIINSVKYVDDADIEKAVKGSYMENWGVRQIKEVFCVSSKQNDTSEK